MATREYACDACPDHAMIPDLIEHHFAQHCANGEHCTHTIETCALDLRVDDHPSKCCICDAPFSTLKRDDDNSTAD